MARERRDVVGKWTLDEAASKAAADGNTAGLIEEIKEDGSFEAMYGTKGSWRITDGELTVSYENHYKKDRPGGGDTKQAPKYQIHYDDFDSSRDEWVGTDRLEK